MDGRTEKLVALLNQIGAELSHGESQGIHSKLD